MGLAATLKLAGSCLLLGLSAPLAAAELIVSNGELVGASGVSISGSLYDVSFVEGSCISVFAGCDEATDFNFATANEANAAASALQFQVFDDGGIFDTNPELTFGCEDLFVCGFVIPYELYSLGLVRQFGFRNFVGALMDDNRSGLINPEIDLTFESRVTFARFQLVAPEPSTPAVPEPSTWAAMLVGFAAIGVAVRRRRRSVFETV